MRNILHTRKLYSESQKESKRNQKENIKFLLLGIVDIVE